MNAVIVRKFDAIWVENMDHRIMVVPYEDFRVLATDCSNYYIMAIRMPKVLQSITIFKLRSKISL